MKKLMMCLLSAAFFAACAGGGSDGGPAGPPNVDEVQEGAGVALDLSGSPAGNTTETEVFVKAAIDQIDRSFSSSTSSSSTTTTPGAGPPPTNVPAENATAGTPPAEGFGASVMNKAMTAKSIDTASALYRACTSNSYTQTINKQITGISGTANFTGSATVNKTSDDQANASENITGTFVNFNYRSYAKDIKADGTASLTGSGTITKGFKELCDAASSGQISGTVAVVMETHEQLTGALSISGQYGAALTFTISSDSAIDSEADTFSATTSGTVNVKSGGKTSTCTVSASLSNSIESATNKVICM